MSIITDTLNKLKNGQSESSASSSVIQLDLSKFQTDPTTKQSKVLPGALLSMPKERRAIGEGFKNSLLYNWIRKTPAGDALFGSEGGADPKDQDRGAVGFFYEYLSKDTADNYFDRYDKLIDKGTDPKRAHEIVSNNLFEDAQIELSETEQKVLRNQKIFDVGGSTLESLDFVTGGTISKGGRLTIKSLDRILSTAKKSEITAETVENIIKQGDIKQAEKDVVSKALAELRTEAGTVNVRDLADAVNSRLLPLNPTQVMGEWLQYENITLPPKLRGNVEQYSERLFVSPVPVAAGGIHFTNLPPGVRDGYFAHSRIEDLPDGVRRIIEVQSDLFQKGRIDSELSNDKMAAEILDRRRAEGLPTYAADGGESSFGMKDIPAREAEIDQLKPYRNTWHERVIREEVKKAAQDGKKALRFPTGETAMKIEGLGQQGRNRFGIVLDEGGVSPAMRTEDLKVGLEIHDMQGALGDTIESGRGNWIITEVLEDGKFNAVPKDRGDFMEVDGVIKQQGFDADGNEFNDVLDETFVEQFDISGKVDTENPIYKFYEKNVAKYLRNKYKAETITDENGVKWNEIKVDPLLARQPVEAFGVGAGVSQDDEGDITFDPKMAALGVLGIAASKKLSKSQAKQSKELLPGDMSPKSESFNKLYLAPRVKTIKQTWTKFVEYIQNSEERLRQLRDPRKLSDATNAYQKMALMHGRMGTRVEEGYDAMEEIAENVVDLVGRKRQAVEDGRTDINRFLQALHAPERNAFLGDGAAGMTTADAEKILSETPAEVKKIGDKVLDLNRKTLEMLHDSEVISDDLFTLLRERYKNHVPLQRVFEGDDIGNVLSGSTGGLDVRSSGIKGAKGSDLEVADILTNVTNNYEQAVIRSEKNIVDQATLAFVRDEKELGHLFEVTSPKAVGESFTKVDEAGEKFRTPIFQQINDPQILRLFEKGKPVDIRIKDPLLADAMKGAGQEKLGVFLRAVGSFTRLYAGLATRFNPEFALSNKIRDIQETVTYLASEDGATAKIFAKQNLKKISLDSTKAIIDGLRGADTSGAKLYREMKEAGGTTGGLGLSTREQTELNIDKIFATARSRPRKAAFKLVEYVDNWNKVFEDSTRLSVYKASLEAGLSKERAAFYAKEASINFNRKGKGGPVINAVWMFSNASIQGSFKLIRAMKNPKVAAGVSAAVGSSVAAVSEWNDRVDPDWRDKVAVWDRNSNLPIMLPSEDGGVRYFVIPVSWGLKPIMVAANTVYDTVSGVEVDLRSNVGNILSSVIDAYNPLGGSDPLSSVTPTILDTPFEIARNKKWSGSKIRPDYDPSAPKDIQYFSSLADTAFGRTEIATTRKLADSTGILISPADMDYALKSYMSGAGRSITKTGNLLWGFSSPESETPPLDEWPFVSRFLRMRGTEEVGQGAGGDVEKLKELKSDQSRERFLLKEEARGVKSELDSLPEDVAKNRFNVLIETNPDLAKKVNEIIEDDKLGRTYEDSLIYQLGVDNGERAKFIHTKLNQLKSDEQRKALWDEYVAKKIISDSVAKQLKELMSSVQ